MNLKEFRAKYPQYDSWSDEDLVRGLHQKFYSKGPHARSFEDFSKEIGYVAPKSVEKPGLLDMARGGLRRLGHKMYESDVAAGAVTPPKSGDYYKLAPSAPAAPYDVTYPVFPGPPRMGLGQFITSIPSGTAGFLKNLGQALYGPTVPKPEEHYIPTKTMPRVPEAPYDQPIAEPEPTALDKLKHVGKRVPKGLGKMAHDVARVPGMAAFMLDRYLLDPNFYKFPHWKMDQITDPELKARAQEYMTYEDTEFGKLLKSGIDELEEAFPDDPRLRDSYIYTILPDAGVSLGGFMLASYLTGGSNIAVSALASILEGSEAYDEAMEATGDPWKAAKAAGLRAPAGLLEMFGIEQIMRPLLRAIPPGQRVALGKMLIQGLKTGSIEAGEEVAQGLWGNIIANLVYSKRDLAEGLWQAGTAGGFWGVLAQVLASMAGLKLRGGKLFGRGDQLLYSEEGPGDFYTKGQAAIEAMTPEQAREILRKTAETTELKPGPGGVETEVRAKTVLPKPTQEALEQRARATPELEEQLREAHEMEAARVQVGVGRLGEALRRIQEPTEKVEPQRKVEKEPPAKPGKQTLYHATGAEFMEFRPRELGIHLGTTEQAGEVAERIGKGAKILRVEANIQNPLRMEDMAEWDPADVVERLYKDNVFTNQDHLEFTELREKTTREFSRGTLTADGAEERLYGFIKDRLKKQGYDGIVYENEEEGEGDSFIAFDRSQIKILPEEEPPAKLGKAKTFEQEMEELAAEAAKTVEVSVQKEGIREEEGKVYRLMSEEEWGNVKSGKTYTGRYWTSRLDEVSGHAREGDIVAVSTPTSTKIWSTSSKEKIERGEAFFHESKLKDLKEVEAVYQRRGNQWVQIEGKGRFAGHETPVSPEAISRMEQGKFVYWDIRTNKVREDTSKEAVDLAPGEAEIKAWVPNKGKPTIYAFGKHFDKQGLGYRNARRQMFLNILKERQAAVEAPAKIAKREAPKRGARTFEATRQKDEATRKVHRDFATWLYDWSTRQLGEPIGGRPGIKETKVGEATLFQRLEVFSPEKVQHMGVEDAVKAGHLSKDEGIFIQGILSAFPQAWQEHFEVRISGQEFAPTETHLRAHGYAPGAEGLRVEGVLLTERIGDAKTDAKHIAVLFKGSNAVTFLHEFAEFIHRRALNMGERQLVGKLHKESGSRLERREWFCMEFEKWFVQDKPVKDKKLLRIFHKVLQALQNVYRRLTAKKVNPQLAKMLKNLVTSGRDIRTDYYYSNQEALERYVLGQPASGTILESGGFANNSKTGISWDPASQCNKQLAFVDFIREYAPKYGLTEDELVHPEVLADLYDLARANGVDVPCERCYVIGRRYAALRVQARGGTKGEVEFQRAKQAYFTVPYKGQILKWSKKKIEDANKRGGLRLFSFSGYNRQFHHAIVDILLRDAEKVGLAVKAITENPDFIEDFGDRNILINASIDSKLTGVDGMSWDDAAKWKEKYPDTVKVRAVFGSIPDLVRLADLKHGGFDPFIDVLTPYHHEDKESPLPAGAQDLSMSPVPTVAAQEMINFINRKRPDLAERTCCIVGAKWFSEKHDKQCACNCGLLAGNKVVPRNDIYAKVGEIDEAATLIGWVRSMGGIWDPSLRGETREFTPDESGIVGLVRKGGRPWDDLVDDAIASGWLDEGATSDDFREALRRDIQMVREGGERIHASDADIEAALDREMEESFPAKPTIPEDWRKAGILVKEQFPAPKKFRGVSAKERGRRISAGRARAKARREAGGSHGQAANEDWADRTQDVTLSFLGMGEAPGVFSDMVKDILHYAGVKSREPGRKAISAKDINWKNIFRYVQMPDDLRRTFKQFDPVYQIQIAREVAKQVLDNTMAKITEPYFSLKEKDRRAVDQMLLEGERAGIEMMEEADFQKYDATPEQIKGYTAIRKGLNTARELLIAKMEEYGVAEDVIEDFSNRSKGYVPHKWYGDWAIVVKQKTKKGKVAEPKAPWGGAFKEPTTRTVFMSAVGYTERWREVERLQKIFPKSEGYTVADPIKRTKIDYAAFQEAPSYAVTSMVDHAMEKAGFDEQAKTDMAGALRDLYKSKGFGMHYIKRKGVAGYEENLTRPLAEYFVGFSGYLTKMEAIQAFPKAMVGISMDKTPNLYKYALDYITFVTGEEYDWHHVKTAAYMFYLFGNIKSATLNLTQNLVLGWPVLSTKTHFALPKMMQAMARTASGMLTKGEREFVAALEEAGHLDPQLAQEIGGYAGNAVFRPFMGLGRKAFALLDVFGHAERFNRRAMAVALYDSGVRDFNEAAKLITDAHFQYSKGNRPYISMQFRGALSPVMVFRSWYINYISWLKNQIKAGNVRPLMKSLTALTFFGGLGALPFWDILKGLWIKMFGEDPETAARRLLGQRFGRDLMHGMPAEIGVEFSGSIGMADIIPKNLEDIVGVFGDIPGRIKKVWKAYLSGDYIRMLEDAAPEALKNPFAAYRLYKDGATSRSGRPVLDLTTGKQLKATKKEAILKTFGFYPIRLAEQYNIGQTLDTVKKDRMEIKQAWADRYRIASLNGDTEKMKRIIGEVVAYNKEMRDADRPEDQITTDELRAMIRIRSRAVNRPPKYMFPKLKKLREQYKEGD